MPSDQRDRAVREPHHRGQAEYMCHGDPDEVLQKDEDRDHDAHFEDEIAAPQDQPQARHVADAREEEHHAPVLHDGVLAVVPYPLCVEDAVHDGEDRPADDWRGDAVLAKEGDFPLQKSAKKKDCHSGSQRLIHIECDSHSLLPFIETLMKSDPAIASAFPYILLENYN